MLKPVERKLLKWGEWGGGVGMILITLEEAISSDSKFNAFYSQLIFGGFAIMCFYILIAFAISIYFVQKYQEGSYKSKRYLCLKRKGDRKEQNVLMTIGAVFFGAPLCILFINEPWLVKFLGLSFFSYFILLGILIFINGRIYFGELISVDKETLWINSLSVELPLQDLKQLDIFSNGTMYIETGKESYRVEFSPTQKQLTDIQKFWSDLGLPYYLNKELTSRF